MISTNRTNRTSLEKFHDIRKQLAECKSAVMDKSPGSDFRTLDVRRCKLQNALRKVKRQLAQSVSEALQKADQHRDGKDYEKARVLYQSALNANPPTKCDGDLVVLERHAQCCLHTGHAEEALADGDQMVRSWPHEVASHYVRGEAHIALCQPKSAAVDFERTLTLLTESEQRRKDIKCSQIELSDVRAKMRRAYDLMATEDAASASVVSSQLRARRMWSLPAQVLTHAFTYCDHFDLCRLETVCMESASLLIRYRCYLWKPLTTRLFDVMGMKLRLKPEQCFKVRFQEVFRVRAHCANCGHLYDPMNHNGGCRENWYHPGKYTVRCRGGGGVTCECTGAIVRGRERHRCPWGSATFWTCCPRVDDYIRRVDADLKSKELQKASCTTAVPSKNIYSTAAAATSEPMEHLQQTLTQVQHESWPAHLGEDDSFDFAQLPCKRGCQMGPHSDRPGHFWIDTPQFDPLFSSRLRHAPKCRNAGSWQELVHKYRLVRKYIRSGHLKGVSSKDIWWQVATSKRSHRVWSRV